MLGFQNDGRKAIFSYSRAIWKSCKLGAWEKSGEKPKSNISNIDIFDIKKNPSLLNILKTDVVMVALNFARTVEMNELFLNFHDKIRMGRTIKLDLHLKKQDFTVLI